MIVRTLALGVLFAITAGYAGAATLLATGDSLVEGTASFDGSPGNPDLTGNIDFAVFTAADFTALFPTSGYVPTAELVYTYQVENTGADDITFEFIALSNPASGISFADIGGDVAPSASFFDGGGNANFSFAGDPISQFETSQALVFSSSNLPELIGGGLTVNGGTTAVATPIAVPGGVEIPEPNSVLIIASAGVLAVFTRRRKI